MNVGAEPPLVYDAVKMTDVPVQILFCDGLIETVGAEELETTICTLVLVAVDGETHGALLVIITQTESLFCKAAVVYVLTEAL